MKDAALDIVDDRRGCVTDVDLEQINLASSYPPSGQPFHLSYKV